VFNSDSEQTNNNQVQQQQQEHDESELLTPDELQSPVKAALKYKKEVARLNEEKEALLKKISLISQQLES